ncbi:MAG: PEP-CTERM sorting domain-containing protein [Candidatus Auribacterota bacterium]|jgi:hypothetical protein|nr:PEP-CTERM sorting domain-containing protein [Candidatus Auribacterota bacterium]
MQKVLLSLLMIISFFINPPANASEITWNFSQKTTWGDGVQPDGDIYGNTDVWYYKYAPLNSTNYTQYQLMPYWVTSVSAWSFVQIPGASVDNNWLTVFSNQIAPGNLNDAVIEFKAPYTGLYDIYAQLYNWNGQAHQYSDGQNFYIQKMGTILDSVYNPVGGTSSLSKQDVALTAGESIFLRVNMNLYTYYDSIIIQQFSITGTFPDPEVPPDPESIPEPLSVILFCFGLCGIFFKKSRR